LLIANRGEIAVRIIRACRDLGIAPIAVYSDADRAATHVRLADQAVRLGPAPPADSYLRIDLVLDAARDCGAQAVHPGYGFLAERSDFARVVEDAGLVFVGPPSQVIAALGDKLGARRLARDVGVPVVPGTLEPAVMDPGAPDPGALERLHAEAAAVGFPLLVKAAAGGGGRGMRRVARAEDLAEALAAGAAEALAAFGDGAVYLERELTGARHVEVQLLGDTSGHVVALGERDCSLQRRHQKLVEEAPAPGLAPELRRQLHDRAVRLGRAAGLRSAATAEFLLTADGACHFLEVNTRLQVEHGVTELVTGIDLVHEQLRIAAGQPLSPAVLKAAEQASDPGSHAIEVRLAAEDPAADFSPTPGRIRHWVMPGGPGVRVDAGVEAGDLIPLEYDNLVAKVIAAGPDRAAALARLARALAEVEIAGIQTNLPFHRFVASSPAFADPARLSTAWVTEHWDGAHARRQAEADGALAAALWAWRHPPGIAGPGAAGLGIAGPGAVGPGIGGEWNARPGVWGPGVGETGSPPGRVQAPAVSRWRAAARSEAAAPRHRGGGRG
jgi:acetyl/propionyl-CoA carboxylase alpha subunit